ncbi:GNAT superfamily N-acetyltransferase [Caulobacter ginsengisoli]|uniref:GNAT superfamily N-acetyltransferase n=1 Tax=Caulobacter ginsengisoli TaxID=400775 RepID=A0ABU0IMZ6_9CAUL|nr:GNAT family N-acetyltransferase [Caulobacter ginsengisoli]MDQ0463390.1 GNAT superfamily N-acetyltransferase [Caulobacter ginsengisoli]
MPGLSRLARLRPPQPDELAALSDLCLRSKAWWGYDAAFLAACLGELTLTPEELDRDAIIVAELSGRPAGVAQVAVTDREASLEKLFVEPEAIGEGLGALLFDWCAAAAAERGADHMVIESDPGAADFYRRMGARDDGLAPSGSVPGRKLPRLRLEIGA